MRCVIKIPTGLFSNYNFLLHLNGQWECCAVEGVCVIYVRKFHNHSYRVESFFYSTKLIDVSDYRGLKEMLRAVQNMVYENCSPSGDFVTCRSKSCPAFNEGGGTRSSS